MNKNQVWIENEIEKSTALSKKGAHTTMSTLRTVVTHGTGGGAWLSSGTQSAGKTGTTDDDKDRWFVGLTPYYVGAVWYGFDEPKDMGYLTNNPALAAWKMVMSEVHKGLSYKGFAGSGNEVEVKICSVSGKLCVPTCVDAEGNSTGSVSRVPYSSAPTAQCEPENHNVSTEEVTVEEGESSEAQNDSVEHSETNEGSSNEE